MKLRLLVCMIVGVFVLSLFAPVPGATDVRDYLVLGASGAELKAEGVSVIDDYDTFATAWLTASDVVALEQAGLIVTPIDHASGRGQWRGDLQAMPAATSAPATDVYIVQFRGPVKAEWADALRERVTVFDYLPHNSFLVRLGGEPLDALDGVDGLRTFVPYHPGFKLAPELPTTGPVQATALGYLDVPLKTMLAEVLAAGGHPTGWTTAQLEHVVDFTIDAERLDDVADQPSVMWIEPAYDEGSSDNAMATAISQSGSVGVFTLYDKGIDGRSQKLSVCDTGANTDSGVALPIGGLGSLLPIPVIQMTHEMHDDSAGGYLVYNSHISDFPDVFGEHRKMDLYYSPVENNQVRGDSDDSSGHGTHTAGTVAGDAPGYGAHNNNDGVAYAAKLLVCDITTGSTFHILNDYANYWNPAYDRGARVNSNSWGSAHTNTYTEKARQHDAYVWDHRDFLILRSMGNTGLGSIRPEAVAKSAMGIGSTQNGLNAETLSGFSTGGLTADGRMKPNVVAPGECLTSSYLSGATSYSCISGTSMSTPTVAGAAGLVRDYFERGFYPTGAENNADAFNPSAALVRAVLQVSGKEISGDRGQADFPNKAQGWGRVLLDDALQFDGDGRDLVVLDEGAGLSTGATDTHSFTVAAGQALRIMVAWSDQPGAAGANPALVNDLDLKVTGPGGVYIGNNFVGNEVPAGTAAPDTRNVEEAVYINSPTGGTYTVEVTGSNVPSGPQPYVVVVTGALA